MFIQSLKKFNKRNVTIDSLTINTHKKKLKYNQQNNKWYRIVQVGLHLQVYHVTPTVMHIEACRVWLMYRWINQFLIIFNFLKACFAK